MSRRRSEVRSINAFDFSFMYVAPWWLEFFVSFVMTSGSICNFTFLQSSRNHLTFALSVVYKLRVGSTSFPFYELGH